MKHPLTQLAKKAVEEYIKNKEIIKPPRNFPKEFLTQKSGVFVTIENNNKLRGCIGTYLPTKNNIAEEVISNAISAATNDYRFLPIQEDELNKLSYIVYLLSPPKPVKDISELDPKKYGILVKSFGKSGLLLPDLEGIDSTEKQIIIACHKAGIDPVTEPITIFKFSAKKYQ